MKKLIASLCVAGSVAFAGCNTSPTGGRTPGTSSTGPGGSPAHTTTTSGKKETFRLETAPGAAKVEQGGTKTFKISISRDSTFKDDVALKAESTDPKVHVTVEPDAFKGSEKKDVEVTVKADDDAKIGTDEIKITGTPQSGAPATLDVKVDVTAKAKNK